MIYHFYHLRRSGSHAVLEWVMRHFDGLNGLTNNMKSSPVRRFFTTHVMHDGEFVNRDLKRDIAEADGGEYRWEKSNTFITYEDWETSFSEWAKTVSRNEAWIVGPGLHFPFACIRSIYNNAASRIKISRSRGVDLSHSFNLQFVEDWKRLAREAMKNDRIIRFDHLIEFEDYRAMIRRVLDLPEENADRADAGFKYQAHIPYGGKGSTFEGRVPDARNLPVNLRWKEMQDDPWFRRYILADNELAELNSALFGQTGL